MGNCRVNMMMTRHLVPVFDGGITRIMICKCAALTIGFLLLTNSVQVSSSEAPQTNNTTSLNAKFSTEHTLSAVISHGAPHTNDDDNDDDDYNVRRELQRTKFDDTKHITAIPHHVQHSANDDNDNDDDDYNARRELQRTKFNDTKHIVTAIPHHVQHSADNDDDDDTDDDDYIERRELQRTKFDDTKHITAIPHHIQHTDDNNDDNDTDDDDYNARRELQRTKFNDTKHIVTAIPHHVQHSGNNDDNDDDDTDDDDYNGRRELQRTNFIDTKHITAIPHHVQHSADNDNGDDDYSERRELQRTNFVDTKDISAKSTNTTNQHSRITRSHGRHGRLQNRPHTPHKLNRLHSPATANNRKKRKKKRKKTPSRHADRLASKEEEVETEVEGSHAAREGVSASVVGKSRPHSKAHTSNTRFNSNQRLSHVGKEPTYHSQVREQRPSTRFVAKDKPVASTLQKKKKKKKKKQKGSKQIPVKILVLDDSSVQALRKKLNILPAKVPALSSVSSKQHAAQRLEPSVPAKESSSTHAVKLALKNKNAAVSGKPKVTKDKMATVGEKMAIAREQAVVKLRPSHIHHVSGSKTRLKEKGETQETLQKTSLLADSNGMNLHETNNVLSGRLTKSESAIKPEATLLRNHSATLKKGAAVVTNPDESRIKMLTSVVDHYAHELSAQEDILNHIIHDTEQAEKILNSQNNAPLQQGTEQAEKILNSQNNAPLQQGTEQAEKILNSQNNAPLHQSTEQTENILDSQNNAPLQQGTEQAEKILNSQNNAPFQTGTESEGEKDTEHVENILNSQNNAPLQQSTNSVDRNHPPLPDKAVNPIGNLNHPSQNSKSAPTIAGARKQSPEGDWISHHKPAQSSTAEQPGNRMTATNTTGLLHAKHPNKPQLDYAKHTTGRQVPKNPDQERKQPKQQSSEQVFKGNVSMRVESPRKPTNDGGTKPNLPVTRAGPTADPQRPVFLDGPTEDIVVAKDEKYDASATDRIRDENQPGKNSSNLQNTLWTQSNNSIPLSSQSGPNDNSNIKEREYQYSPVGNTNIKQPPTPDKGMDGVSIHTGANKTSFLNKIEALGQLLPSSISDSDHTHHHTDTANAQVRHDLLVTTNSRTDTAQHSPALSGSSNIEIRQPGTASVNTIAYHTTPPPVTYTNTENSLPNKDPRQNLPSTGNTFVEDLELKENNVVQNLTESKPVEKTESTALYKMSQIVNNNGELFKVLPTLTGGKDMTRSSDHTEQTRNTTTEISSAPKKSSNRDTTLGDTRDTTLGDTLQKTTPAAAPHNKNILQTHDSPSPETLARHQPDSENKTKTHVSNEVGTGQEPKTAISRKTETKPKRKTRLFDGHLSPGEQEPQRYESLLSGNTGLNNSSEYEFPVKPNGVEKEVLLSASSVFLPPPGLKALPHATFLTGSPATPRTTSELVSVLSETMLKEDNASLPEENSTHTASHTIPFFGTRLRAKQTLVVATGLGTTVLLFTCFLCVCSATRWHRHRQYRKVFDKLEKNFSDLDTEKPVYLRLSQLRRSKAGNQYVVTM